MGASGVPQDRSPHGVQAGAPAIDELHESFEVARPRPDPGRSLLGRTGSPVRHPFVAVAGVALLALGSLLVRVASLRPTRQG